MDLQLDWCDYEAAEYAVDRWHYSDSMPSGALIKIGVWEAGRFVGVVLYGRGGAPNIASPFEMEQSEVCELVRVALDDHETPTTRVLSISRKLLTDCATGLRVIVSYADPREDHDGTLYQADNWCYLGQRDPRDYIAINGEEWHPRSLNAKYGTSSVSRLRDQLPPSTDVTTIPVPGKHKYAYPLDDDAQQMVESMSEPYPKTS